MFRVLAVVEDDQGERDPDGAAQAAVSQHVHLAPGEAVPEVGQDTHEDRDGDEPRKHHTDIQYEQFVEIILRDIRRNGEHLGPNQYARQHKDNGLGTEHRIRPEPLHIALHLARYSRFPKRSHIQSEGYQRDNPRYFDSDVDVFGDEVDHITGDDGDVDDEDAVVEDPTDPVGADDGEQDAQDGAADGQRQEEGDYVEEGYGVALYQLLG